MIGKAIKFTAILVLGLFLLWFGLCCFFPPRVVNKSLAALLFGWWQFLDRVFPEVVFNPAAVGMGLICSLLLLWSAHRFCTWLYGGVRLRHPEESTWPPAWPWRWTASLYGGLWLLFLTSLAVTGMTHQIGWLMRADQPVVVNQRRLFQEEWTLNQAADFLLRACETNGWDSRKVQALCLEAVGNTEAHNVAPVSERWHFIFIESQTGTTAAIYLAYRAPDLRTNLGYYRVTKDDVTSGSIERMAEDIRTFTVKPEAPAK